MTNNRRNRIIAATGTLLVHVVVLYILFCIVLKSEPVPQDMGSGVFVQIGNIDEASGMFEPYMPEEVLPPTERIEIPVEPDVEELITQETEESISLEEKKKQEAEKRRREEERRRIEAERREQERLLAEQRDKASRVNNAMQNAFGSGSTQSTSRGDGAGEGVQGSPTGNAPTGASQGIGGWGGFSLAGRKCLSLPKPTYNSNVEGTIVVEITVDREGRVSAATIKAGSSTHEGLRKAALSAARKALFDKSSKHNTQVGTITYYFKQR